MKLKKNITVIFGLIAACAVIAACFAGSANAAGSPAAAQSSASTSWAAAGEAKSPGEKIIITMGTGDPRGLYFYCGKRVEKVINLTNKKFNVIGRSSNGALDNINSVAAGTADFGFTQLDMLLRAGAGAGEFNGVKHENLAVVTVLFPEVFTIVGSEKIEKIEDFDDKFISTHLPGSGVFQNSEQLLKIAGLENGVKKVNLNMGDTEKHFCDGHIDGFFSVIGMPAAVVTNSIAKVKGARVIGLSTELKNKVSDSIRGFVPYEIPVQTYSNDKPVPTIATFAVIFTTVAASDESVNAMLNTIYSLPDFSTAAGTRHGKVRYISRENAAKLLGGVKDLKLHRAAAKFFGIEK